MTGVAVLLRKELAEQWRTLRLPIVAIVFLFVGLSSPLLARYTPELVEALAGDQIQIPFPPPQPSDAVDQLLKNLLQFGGLAAILLAMGSIAGEKERGTAALLLTTPASRAAFLGAKAIAIGVTLAVGTVLAIASGWVYTAMLFGPPSIGGFAAAGLLVWLILAAYSALTFLASTVLGSPIGAGAVGFGAFLGLSLLSAVPRVGAYLPSGLTTPARALAIGEAADPLAGPVLATAALVAAALILAGWSFRRQEL